MTLATLFLILMGAFGGAGSGAAPADAGTVGDSATKAQSADGAFISWREHIVDEAVSDTLPLSGSDGLEGGDLDGDGREDFVSVHESDTRYDGVPDGHVRIAFAGETPDEWTNITLINGTDAAAPEDVDIADVNGDGFPDVIVASELAHLIFVQNPGGGEARTAAWPRLILPMTQDRGSWIRVFLADFNGDGRPEAVGANKGAQNPDRDNIQPTAISIFEVVGDPMTSEGWREMELGRYLIPQNSQPVDLDGDGDLDIVAGIRAESRLILFENVSRDGTLAFEERALEVAGGRSPAGFNLAYADLNADTRLDIIAAGGRGALYWLAQPDDITAPWTPAYIGSFEPDSMTGFTVADIDGDGDSDVIAGSYSRGPRAADGEVTPEDALGRLGWFENLGEAGTNWKRHDISRRKRGMFDKFLARDLDGDGDVDFIGTRGNSEPYDGVFWLEQVRSARPLAAFRRARDGDSAEMPLPEGAPAP